MNILKLVKNSAILIGKSRLTSSIYAGAVISFCLLGMLTPHTIIADFDNKINASYIAKETNIALRAVKTIKVLATAYSSTPEQTDDTPFTTASGKSVKDGIIANNMLPFGTKIRIPDLYGDKVFVVEDRMNKRKSKYHVDIWMPDLHSAVDFGVKKVDIEIIES